MFLKLDKAFFTRAQQTATSFFRLAVNVKPLNGTIIPYFQPIVRAKDGRVLGVEVLMRKIHPNLGIISPDEFVPCAEANGDILFMTKEIIKHVSEIVKNSCEAYPIGFHISLNITPQLLQEDTLIVDLFFFKRLCETKNLLLVIEITERTQLQHNDEILRSLKILSNIGVKIALDDFGVGYSNLSLLCFFSFDFLKIDKSFILNVGKSKRSEHIIDSIVNIAKELNVMVVAEGVESHLQETYLRSKGVDYLQGFLYSKPLSQQELNSFMAKYTE
ncbi:EAL domain-containing protein [Aeromonas salmonicida]|uniref:EAL domain-containing protein n=1 Tax=Aeromonas salmonicida TaxID=645 RepID=UPI0010280635|nr:EAL domain-containing protein [Aeromonas salmonicida]VFB09610.1 EAL domain-containing protein [Aeromonas salmonicida]